MKDTNRCNTEQATLHMEKKVPFFTFPPLSNLEYITHGFSSKLGGVSEGYFSSMNLGFNRGDKEENVIANYKLMADSMGIPYNQITASDQIHETKIRRITKEDMGKGIIRKKDYSGVDGLITNIPNIPLVTYYADCVPLYLIDKKNLAIGLSHSGWRGTVKKMGRETIKRMEEEFGTKAEDLMVVIGPSICKDCYEVSHDVYEEFRKVFSLEQMELLFTKKENKKYQLDLWEANRQIFLGEGVSTEDIHCSQVCTCCNSDIMFSHRVHGTERGTLAAFLMLR